MDTDCQNTGKSVKKGLKPWVKGQSGNPGGRPKTAGLVDYIRKKSNNFQDLADALFELADSKDERIRLSAISELLDRGPGKAIITQLQGNLNEGDTYTLLHGHEAPKPPEADGKP